MLPSIRTLLRACELKRKVAVLAILVMAGSAAVGARQPHEAQPAREAAEAEHSEPEHAEGEHHGLSGLIWPTVNFAILVGALYYFLREPFTSYLRDRHATIRKDLVSAGEVRQAATAQLAEIEARLKALPGEIEALRRRGAEETASEERRIGEQAAAERDRLLEQTRREIDLQVRLAKRELVEHAATLAVQMATERVEREITPDDHRRLTERYLDQVEKGRTH